MTWVGNLVAGSLYMLLIVISPTLTGTSKILLDADVLNRCWYLALLMSSILSWKSFNLCPSFLVKWFCEGLFSSFWKITVMFPWQEISRNFKESSGRQQLPVHLIHAWKSSIKSAPLGGELALHPATSYYCHNWYIIWHHDVSYFFILHHPCYLLFLAV